MTADNHTGAVTAVNHLLELGHRRIGFIAGRSTLAASWAREQGYLEALANAGIAVDSALIGRGDFHRETARTPARELLNSPDRPTAIFAASDGMALTVLEVARELEIKVPGDLSIIGFDNIPESAAALPPLTTIDQSMRQFGYEAAMLLQRLVSGHDGEPEQVFVPTRLIVRGSTAAPVRDFRATGG